VKKLGKDWNKLERGFTVSVVEWEWRKEDPDAYANLDALDAWGVYALGEQVRLLILRNPDDPDDKAYDGAMWSDYAALQSSRDGFTGYEALGDYATLDEAKTAVELDRKQPIHLVKGV
jgi:hypothetical protein